MKGVTFDVYSAEATAERIALSIDRGSARALRFSSREQRKTGQQVVAQEVTLSADNRKKSSPRASRLLSGEQKQTGQARLVGRDETRKVSTKSSERKASKKTKKKSKFVMQSKIKAWGRKARLSRAVDWEEQQHNCFFLLDHIKTSSTGESKSDERRKRVVTFSKSLVGIHLISDPLEKADESAQPANRFRQELNAMKRYSTEIFNVKNKLRVEASSTSSHSSSPSSLGFDSRMQINAITYRICRDTKGD